jgi:hypothetical protein
MDIGVIRFKYHDRMKHHPIDFQSVNPGTTQNDEHFCAYRRSVKLHPSQNASPINARGLLLNVHTTSESTRFYMTKKGAPDQHLVLLLYFLHSQHHVQKARRSQSMSHPSSILFTCATLRTKRKWLSIDLMLYFYTFYTRNATYKKQGASNQNIIVLFIHIHH